MSAYDVAGTIFGVLGTVGIFQMLYNFVNSNLPSERLKELIDTLNDTNALFDSVIEEGILFEKSFVTRTEKRLDSARVSAEKLRTQVHCATDFSKQFHEMISGLSRKIILLRSDVEEIRADISFTVDMERRKIERVERLSRNPLATPDVYTLSAAMHFDNTVGAMDSKKSRLSRSQGGAPHILVQMPNLATSGAGPSSLTSLPPIRHAMSLTNVQPMDYRLSPTARHRQRTSDMLSSIGSSTAVNSHTSSQAQDHSHLSRRTPRETDPLLPGRPALQDGSGTGVPLEMTTLVEMVQRLRQNVVLLTAAFDNSQQRPPPETHATIEEINSSETNPFDDAAAEGGDSGSVVDSSEGAAQPNTTSSQDLAPLGSTSADSGVKEQPSSIAQEDHATQGTALTEQERISSVLQDLIPPSALPTPSDGETRVLDSVAEEDELPATPKARVAVHA